MRQFVVVGQDAPTTPEFSLDALPEAGRLDLLARCVTSSLLLSHGIRDDVQTHLVLSDEFTVRFDGQDIRGLHPDERSSAALIRTALEQREEAVGHMEVETSPGVSLSRLGVAETLDALPDSGTVIQLHESGVEPTSMQLPENPIFVLSDNRDLSSDALDTLEQYRDERLSLGPKALHADHSISVAHNWLDTAGFDSFRADAGD